MGRVETWPPTTSPLQTYEFVTISHSG